MGLALSSEDIPTYDSGLTGAFNYMHLLASENLN